MDNGENRNASSGETEVYSVSPSGNITYNEIVTPNRNVVPGTNSTFKTEWQNFPEFQSWLRPVPDDKTKAWCQACEKVFRADLKSLRVHGVGRSHVRMVHSKFPEAAASSPPPAAVYNVITDRKGTYGLGILSKTESNPTAGSTLYVNPTNPNTNVLTCDPKQDKDNFVIVSMPKNELADSGNQRNEIQGLRELQFDSRASPVAQKKTSNIESYAVVASTGDSKIRGPTKRSASNSNANTSASGSGTCNSTGENDGNSVSKMQKTACESFAEELIDTEDLEDEEEEEVDDDDDEDEEEEEEDDDSVYDFESRMEKAKYSLNRKRFSSTFAKKRLSEYSPSHSLSSEIATVTRAAPFWKSKAIVNGHVSELKLTDYMGRYLILFFYPQDFSKPCAKEISELSDRISEFRNINTEIVACSVDSYLTHQVWCKMSKSDGGVAYPKVPLLSDHTHTISKAYGCYLPEAGHTLRAHYVIDAKGILRHVTMHDVRVTRDVNEIFRLVQSFQRIDECATDTIIVKAESV